jgi:uncharacterized metal-binding protein YceD (DUF177 family)
MTAKTHSIPEFSRPVDVETLGDVPVRLDIHADAEERAALARRFGLVDLASLSAHVSLERDAAGDVRLSGRLVADIAQTCVVSLETLRTTIDAPIERAFSPTAEPDAGGDEEVFLAPEDDEPADHYADGSIDVGEAVAEALGLEIDPFPRAPGAVFRGAEATPADMPQDVEKTGPFAALAKLKTRR